MNCTVSGKCGADCGCLSGSAAERTKLISAVILRRGDSFSRKSWFSASAIPERSELRQCSRHMQRNGIITLHGRLLQQTARSQSRRGSWLVSVKSSYGSITERRYAGENDNKNRCGELSALDKEVFMWSMWL